jgi:hypothetical protein
MRDRILVHLPRSALQAGIGAAILIAACAAKAPAAEPAKFDLNVAAIQGWNSGEPEMALDLRNPKDIVIISTGNAQWIPVTEMIVGNTLRCTLSVSHDGGRTWDSSQNAPLYNEYDTGADKSVNIQVCGDPVAAAGPDGTLYVGGTVWHSYRRSPPAPGVKSNWVHMAGDNQNYYSNFDGVHVRGITFIRSADGGRSWSTPISNNWDAAKMRARGMHVPDDLMGPNDRPFLRVDQSNGAIVVSTTSHVPERYLAVSHDKGDSWSEVQRIGSDQYPEGGGSFIEVAHGLVAAAYIAKSAPKANCPCLVFEISSDDGRSWVRHVVLEKFAAGEHDPFIASDSSKKGPFALMVVKKPLQNLEVRVTNDSGATWSGPVILGDNPKPHRLNRPWITYSPSGVLGVLWRLSYLEASQQPATDSKDPLAALNASRSHPQDVFTAISRDGGKSFSDPIQINSVTAPRHDAVPGTFPMDDFSFVAVGKDYLYGAWGQANDDKPYAVTQTWFGRVSLSAYQGGQ